MYYFSYRLSLCKLNRRRSKIDKSYKKQYEQAKKEGSEERTDEIAADASYALGEIDDEILYLEHCYLTSVAKKLLLPVPPFATKENGGMWEKSNITRKWRLTSKGITELRDIIRKERKERTELLARWISMLIGLIGAITGLVAVIKK